MASNRILPAASATLSDGRGLATPQFYRFFQSLSELDVNSSSQADIAAINTELAAIQAEIDALPKGAGYPVLQVAAPLVCNGLLQNGFAQLGLRVADSLLVASNNLQLDGDALTPGNTYLYSTTPTGEKGWNALFGMLAEGPGITLADASDGVVTIASDAGSFQSTAVGNITSNTVVAATSGGVLNPSLATPTEVPAIVGVAFTSATSGNPITVMTKGQITDALWSWTPGLPLYCGVAGGALTQTAPTSGAVVQVGVALSATEINVQIGMAYLLN